jgi:uncharacterized protein (TIGR03067 family)
VNEDSKRKGEEWWIGEDTIRSNPNFYGYPIPRYYRLDAGKNPKQIDLSGQANGPPFSKGIYVLDGDELRLCLGDQGKDRPAAFPEKPRPGEVLILQRQKPGAELPKAKDEQPAAKKVLTPEEAIKRMPKENVTVQFKVASVEVSGPILTYPISYYIYLKDGGKFMIVGGFGDDTDQLAFKSLEDFKGKMVRVTGRVESSGNTFGMWVRDLANIEVVKE